MGYDFKGKPQKNLRQASGIKYFYRKREKGAQTMIIANPLYIGTAPEERKKLDNEAYWLRYEACNSGLVLELQDKLAEAQRRNQNIAKELKSDGMPPEKISKLTGLPVEEIETL
jgi:hypothetical protein